MNVVFFSLSIITDSRLLYEVELFKRVTNEPTNYTIIFKYRADCTTGRPTFLEMNEEMMVIMFLTRISKFFYLFHTLNNLVFQNSPAVMEFYPKSDYSNKHQHFLTDRTVDVLVNVKNTTNLMSSIRIFGSPGLSTANLIRLRLKTRSIAAICTETYMKAMKKAKNTTNLIQIGIRKPDDILLRFQKVFLQTNSEYRFPRYTFDFMDPDVNITQVTITANVSV